MSETRSHNFSEPVSGLEVIANKSGKVTKLMQKTCLFQLVIISNRKAYCDPQVPEQD